MEHGDQGGTALGPGEVHVEYAFVEQVSPEVARERLLPLLDDAERERHARFHFEVHRHLYLVAHALCRSLLARYTGIEPAALRFEAREHGKPELAAGLSTQPLRFNLSHTDGMAAVAVARDAIGVDVERIDRRIELEMVARRVFAPVELEGLMARQGPARQRRFFELWTLKEAYVKALGDGITAPLREIAITLPAEALPTLESPHEAGPVWLRLEAPSPDHVMALALRGAAPESVRIAEWTVP